MAKQTRGYDINTLAFLIRKDGIESQPAYINARGSYLDRTMSCSPKEALEWLRFWMAKAIDDGGHGRDDTLRCKFLAAYDLHEELRAQH